MNQLLNLFKMKLFDCLHVIVTFSTPVRFLKNESDTDQFELCLGNPVWVNEYQFLIDIQQKILEVHDVKEFPIVKISCCYYDENKKFPDWYLEQNGKWDGAEILTVIEDGFDENEL